MARSVDRLNGRGSRLLRYSAIRTTATRDELLEDLRVRAGAFRYGVHAGAVGVHVGAPAFLQEPVNAGYRGRGTAGRRPAPGRAIDV
jgi:hypothetical protein